MILEGTSSWGWVSAESFAVDLDPHLPGSTKIVVWRKARALAKSDRLGADLLSELWTQQAYWWDVSRASSKIGDQREWLRYRMSPTRHCLFADSCRSA